MEMEIKGKIYHFKEKCTFAEYLTSFNPKIQMGLKAQANLIARMSQAPSKLNTKEILMMDASEVLEFIKVINKQYGMAGDYDFLEVE